MRDKRVCAHDVLHQCLTGVASRVVEEIVSRFGVSGSSSVSHIGLDDHKTDTSPTASVGGGSSIPVTKVQQLFEYASFNTKPNLSNHINQITAIATEKSGHTTHIPPPIIITLAHFANHTH
jgi:hypothetical protein